MEKIKYPNFKFIKAVPDPVFDISPHHVRMSCCYMDKTGIYHMFADYIDSSFNTVHSFQAVLNYYTSPDLINWTPRGTVIDKGDYNYAAGIGAADCYGVGSPDVLCLGKYIYLFYAGRGSLAPDQPFNGLAHPGEPGYVSSDIMCAVAEMDKNGAPNGPFIKMGIVLKRKYDWETMRLDDPCVVLDENTLHLYYKGFNDNSNRNNLKLGHAASKPNNIQFVRNTDPIFSASEGLEMPRVFKFNNCWNMFLRHFSADDGAVWRHYISKNGINWELKNPNLFKGAGSEPGKGAADMMLIKSYDGTFTGKALSCGLDEGSLKLWLYRVINVSDLYQ